MKNKILVWSMAAYGVIMLVFCVCKSPEAYSMVERRTLQQLPKVQKDAVADGRWMTDLEDAFLDQFPFRQSFRRVKAYTSSVVFGKKENNGYYLWNGWAGRVDYPLNEASIFHGADRFQSLYERYDMVQKNRVYYAIVPDKNYYLGEKAGQLTFDYDCLVEIMQKKLPMMEYIDLFPLLSLEDYYRTDPHWKQENLVKVAQTIAAHMGIQLQETYEEKTLEHPFYGAYYGQLALPMESDSIRYLTNPTLENAKVYDYENQKEGCLYDMEKGMGADPYELFLSGPLSLLTIENPKAERERELIVFRDSFGSSLIPLLTEGYSKITAVDIRYIRSDVLERFVDFENCDVLFLYSTLVLNHSETMK